MIQTTPTDAAPMPAASRSRVRRPRCNVNRFLYAACETCGDYEAEGAHVLEAGDELSVYCGACCPACSKGNR